MKTVLALACLLVATAPDAHGATVQAAAGLGGVAKAGRWTPVTVSVASEREPVEAELVVTWGDTELRRALVMAAATRKELELYVRTSDPRAAIDVRLVAAGGRELAAASAPVRVLGGDDRVAVCVRPDASSTLDGADCTATVLARALPRSPRGYEVADDVVWPAARTGVSAEQDAAFRAWRALEALDASGDLGATPQVSRPLVPRGLPAALTPVVALIGAGYLAAMAAAGWALRRRCARLAWTGALFATITIAACGAVAGVGRVGATRAVHLHHVSLLQQLPGTQSAVLTMRGLAEFPAFDRFALRMPAADGALETSLPRGGASEALDADGYPVVAGVFGAAARQPFAGEALVSVRPIAVDERGDGVTIENRSERTLRDCRLGRGLSARAAPTTLAPGARIDASWTAAGDEAPSGPVITCTSDDAPVPLTEADHPVVMHGITTIAAYRAPAARGDAGD